MDQSNAPLWEAIVKYASKKVIPFHTPGHKLRSGVFPDIEKVTGSSLWAMDASDEIEAPEFNHSFEQVLQLAEDLASDLFNSKSTKFLVNGTSGGIHTMFLGMKGNVLIPRFSHQSVYAGLILSEAKPIYIQTEFDFEWKIPLPPTPELVKKYLADSEISGLLLTYPTYYGTIADIEALVRLTKAHQILLLVDEAHGSHFHFSPELPCSALSVGADFVVQSTHKTLGSLTQSSLLHINNSDWISRMTRNLGVLQTTSPSLIMLGILDAIRREMALSGKNLVGKALELSFNLRKQLSAIPGVRLGSTATISHDPTKIVFNLVEHGLTGLELEFILRNYYNIQVELSDHYNVLVLVTIGDTYETVIALAGAVRDIATRFCKNVPVSDMDLTCYQTLPRQVLDLRTAYAAESENVPLTESQGRISAGFLTPYPPGVPLIVPGEVISKQLIISLNTCLDRGWQVRGVEVGKVSVIKE